MKEQELKDFLNEKALLYNRTEFISTDPISIPHRFRKKEDIEISGFLTATIAWGQRPVIIRNAISLLERMDHAPHDFILNHSPSELKPFKSFTHRTFNGDDCICFIKSLKRIYTENKSLEALFTSYFNKKTHDDFQVAIDGWRKYFFGKTHLHRTLKHFASPVDGSAAKRINMFLRWMIRKDEQGVDFGIWKLSPSYLTCPLDVHSARVARKLGLLNRKQNDWQSAKELTNRLKAFDSYDPVKYDYALFGLGVFEKF